MHAAAIAATSRQLEALINGGMKESETRCAKIEAVEVDDFIRFCEYAYRGDYTVPAWEEVPPEPSPTVSKSHQDDWGDMSMFSRSRKKKGKKGRVELEPSPDEAVYPQEVYPQEVEAYSETKVYDDECAAVPEPQAESRIVSRTPLRTLFNNRNYLTENGPKALILQCFEPKPNSAVEQNFTPVLLAHARLYCFAHVRLIEPLKALSLHKLHKTLLTFKLYAKRIGDIIALARYVYSNLDLPGRSDDGSLNDLKKLVVEYIVCEIDTIGRHDEFVKYVEEGGEFVGDFWRIARDYMV